MVQQCLHALLTDTKEVKFFLFAIDRCWISRELEAELRGCGLSLPLMNNNLHLVLDTLGLGGEHYQHEEVLAVGLGGDDCEG